MKNTDKNGKRIKILRVITQAEVVVWHLKNFIDRSNDDYDLYIAGNNVSVYSEQYPDVNFIDVKILRKISFVQDIRAFMHIVRLCMKLKPQIVHSIMPKAGLIASLASFVTFVPVRMHTFTGQVWSGSKGYKKFFYILIDKFIVLISTACLTDSPSQSAFLASHGIVKNGEPLKCAGKGSLSGVDLSRFDIKLVDEIRDSFRESLGIGKNDFVYIFLARKSITKGIKELFEAFSQIADIPNVKLLFIGPDESDGYLDHLYAQYDHLISKVISLDKVSAHEKYLAISDVLCLPSSSEGFGSIVIEAAAMGVPAVGFDIVGLVDSIADGYSGLLVELLNVGEFSKAMRYLHDNSEKLAEMRINARTRILDSFSADVIYGFQKQFYMKLLLEKNL